MTRSKLTLLAGLAGCVCLPVLAVVVRGDRAAPQSDQLATQSRTHTAIVAVRSFDGTALPGATVGYHDATGRGGKATLRSGSTFVIEGAPDKIVLEISHPDLGFATTEVQLSKPHSTIQVLFDGQQARVSDLAAQQPAVVPSLRPVSQLLASVSPALSQDAPARSQGTRVALGGNPACGPGAGDCCMDGGNGTPGCDDADCCNCICLCDPFCCDVSWDGNCAGQGFGGDCGASNPNSGCDMECSECLEPLPGPCGPGNGDCCAAGGNGTPGCDDEECCTIVCGVDPFCCATSWDGACANQANDLCEVCAVG